MSAAEPRWRLCDADWNGWPDGEDLTAVRRRAGDLGLDGVELGVYDAAVELSPDRLDLLHQQDGPPVTAVLLSLPPASWPGGALSGDVPRLEQQVAACAAACRRLGLPVLGLWPGADPPGADVREGLRRAVDAACGLPVAVEYKPGTAVPDAASAAALCDEVDGAGVLLDTGHAYAAGEDPAVVVRELGDRLLHVHLGDAVLGAGDDDLPCGRVHDLTDVVLALDQVFAGVASFDLYGAVASGRVRAADAVRESRDHVLSRRA